MFRGLTIASAMLATAMLMLPATALPPPALPNDNFAASLPVGVAFAGHNFGTTVEVGEPRPCGAIGSTLWFTFTAPVAGNYVLATQPSQVDTVLAAYSGNGFPLVLKACNDDFAGLNSQITISAAQGEEVRVQLGGFASSQGFFSLRITPA